MCFIVLYIKHQSTRYLLPKWTRILKVIEITLRMLITLVTWISNWYLFDVCKTLCSWYRLSPNFVYLWQIWADCLILVKSRLFPLEGNSIQLLCSNCLLRYKSNFSRILLQLIYIENLNLVTFISSVMLPHQSQHVIHKIVSAIWAYHNTPPQVAITWGHNESYHHLEQA